MGLIMALVLITGPVWGQNPRRKKNSSPRYSSSNEFGLLTGYSSYQQRLPEGEGKYEPVLLMLYYSKAFNRPGKKKLRYKYYVEPQFSWVRLRERFSDFELGVNFGFRLEYQLRSTLISYATLGTGPMYISLESKRQAHGFIFSDNLAFGLLMRIGDQFGVNLQYRFRHISNAGLKLPNKGINSNIFMIGVSRFIGSNKH